MSGSSELITPALAAAAARSWWDQHAFEYLDVHGPALKSRLQWGPEGWNEADLGLLGAVKGKRVLEVGSGACQCSQWLAMAGATGEELNTAKGVMYSEYENSIGTGQVHVWFDKPEGGFPRPKDLVLSRD